MGTSTQLVSAIIEIPIGGTIRVYLDNSAETDAVARQLATLCGCPIRIERVIQPAPPIEKSFFDAPSKKRAASSKRGAKLPKGEAPEIIRQRINKEPQRKFRVGDFLDLGLKKKRINGILYRLFHNQKQIRRVGPGTFQALRSNGVASDAIDLFISSGALKRKVDNATGATLVLAFLGKHRGESMHAADVTKGMKLADDRKPAVTASLNRLAAKGKIQKNGGVFMLPRPELAAEATT